MSNMYSKSLQKGSKLPSVNHRNSLMISEAQQKILLKILNSNERRMSKLNNHSHIKVLRELASNKANIRKLLKQHVQFDEDIDYEDEDKSKFDYFYTPYSDTGVKSYVRPMRFGKNGERTESGEVNLGWNKISKFVLNKDSTNLKQYIKFMVSNKNNDENEKLQNKRKDHFRNRLRSLDYNINYNRSSIQPFNRNENNFTNNNKDKKILQNDVSNLISKYILEDKSRQSEQKIFSCDDRANKNSPSRTSAFNCLSAQQHLEIKKFNI